MVETRNNNVRTHEPWQLVGTAAELYERYLVPSITSLWANDLVSRANPRTGERVLDVACGTGIVARTVSERMSAGRVVGLDINGGMLAVARSTSTQSPVSVEWMEASALKLPFPAHAFDLVLCQLGLQFFPDPSVALKEMLRVLAPDGRGGQQRLGSSAHSVLPITLRRCSRLLWAVLAVQPSRAAPYGVTITARRARSKAGEGPTDRPHFLSVSAAGHQRTATGRRSRPLWRIASIRRCTLSASSPLTVGSQSESSAPRKSAMRSRW